MKRKLFRWLWNKFVETFLVQYYLVEENQDNSSLLFKIQYWLWDNSDLSQ